MSGNEQLHAFYARWQRLEEDKKAVSDDLKELFAEMKGVGFDTKAARSVFRDSVKDRSQIEETKAIYELYWDVLHAHARDAREEQPSGHAPTSSDPHGADESGSQVSPDSHSSTVPGGEPSIPSSDAASAKSNGAPSPDVGRADEASDHRESQSEQATNEPDIEIPTFLQRGHEDCVLEADR